METKYIIIGKVLPERAQLSWPTEEDELQLFNNMDYDVKSCDPDNFEKVTVSIICNQIYVLYSSKGEQKNIQDIHNMIKQFLIDKLSIIGFIKGYAYEVELIRIINIDKNIDIVFGIDTPFLTEKNKGKDLYEEYIRIINIFIKNGYDVFIRKCLEDLGRALKYPHDTSFFCLRALESLREYCKNKYNIKAEKNSGKSCLN